VSAQLLGYVVFLLAPATKHRSALSLEDSLP
jgi:hypothetical protein